MRIWEKSHQFVLLLEISLRLLGRVDPTESVEEVEEGDHHVDEDDQREQGIRYCGHRAHRVCNGFLVKVSDQVKTILLKKEGVKY